MPIPLVRCAGYFNFRLKVCNKLKGLHKVYAMLHTVRRATWHSAGNLKQQDKCDNLSAFWPVAAALRELSELQRELRLLLLLLHLLLHLHLHLSNCLARNNKLAQIVSVATTREGECVAHTA